MESVVTHSFENGVLRIFINSVPHIIIRKDTLLMIQSFVSESGLFYIEWHLKHKPTHCIGEYTKKEVWLKVIEVVNSIVV